MEPILPLSRDFSPSSRRPAGWGRALSRRQVRSLARVGQRWADRDGHAWLVRNIYRKDGMLALEGPGGQPRFVSFGELGRRCRLIEEDEL